MHRFPPIASPHMLHGADYNPDQWPEPVWNEDMRLMKLAGVNIVSIGIFAWARLEPEEGKFDFDWLDRVMELLYANGIKADVATPSAAPPAWLSEKYPETLRTGSDKRRRLHGGRVNYCLTSRVYREKVRIINQKLAQRVARHPALALWHISNEYSGSCHCALCDEAFRQYLQQRYGGSLSRLNEAWNTSFWSHTFTAWEQIRTPSEIGENSIHGQNLDFKRFVTDQTIDFIKNEIAPLRELSPGVPLTTNCMGTYPGLDYFRLAEIVDVVSWDSYPPWHTRGEDWRVAAHASFDHDLYRSMKDGRPFLLMESTPSLTNWGEVNKLKRPGMHFASSLLAVAHGSDSVMYFQWRKSRGGPEKLHGAVVDHVGHQTTRVFQDVVDLGAALAKLDDVVGTTVRAETAVIYDWETRWAIDDLQGLSRQRDYHGEVLAHYEAFWKLGIPVDVIDQTKDIDRYKLVVAPMLYLLRPGTSEKLRRYVDRGGTLVLSYFSAVVDESDLVYLGGTPGAGLSEVLGVWEEEIDSLTKDDSNEIRMTDPSPLGMAGSFRADRFCALLHAKGAEVLATFGRDFYAGRPALTRRVHGKGMAYYVATHGEPAFYDQLYASLARQTRLLPVLATPLPAGVTAQMRTDGERTFVFVLNFSGEERFVDVGNEPMPDVIRGETVAGPLKLAGYDARVLMRR